MKQPPARSSSQDPSTDPASQEVVIQMRRTQISGPLPSPDLLAGYESVLPGLADRIVRMAEANSAHRHELEKAVVHGNVKAQHRGQIFAFALALIGMSIAIWMVWTGLEAAGVALILGELFTLAAVFLGARHFKAKEREKKQNRLGGGQARTQAEAATRDQQTAS